MGTYKNLKKGTKIGLIVSVVLVFAEVFFGVFNLFHFMQVDLSVVLFDIIKISLALLISIFTMLYSFIGYKKPHGNMLRAMFIAFGSITAWIELMPSHDESTEVTLIGMLCAITASLLIVYVAGRLNKIENNIILLIVAGALLAAEIVVRTIGKPEFFFGAFIGACAPLIVLTALGFAYVARYEEHRAAGLADKADAETNE